LGRRSRNTRRFGIRFEEDLAVILVPKDVADILTRCVYFRLRQIGAKKQMDGLVDEDL
jgi:hypothetical protein